MNEADLYTLRKKQTYLSNPAKYLATIASRSVGVGCGIRSPRSKARLPSRISSHAAASASGSAGEYTSLS